MKKKNLNIEKLVHRYLAGEMGTNETASFEEELEKSEQLQKELAFQEGISEMLKDEDYEEFYDLLEKIRVEKREKGFVLRLFRKSEIRYAAAVAIILIATGVTLWCSRSHFFSQDRIFDKYYASYSARETTRSFDEGAKFNNYNWALRCYNQGNYVLSEKYFGLELNNDPNNIAAKFYLGVSKIELGKYNYAIQLFEEVITSKDPFYFEHSEWYKALCYVKLRENEKATNILTNICERNGFYKKEANNLLALL